MAKDIRIIFSGDTSRADAAIQSLQRTGQQAASILEREFNQLGIKSAQSFDNQRAAADKAFDRIKTSGLATANELERAEKAHAARMVAIDEDQYGKRITLADKLKTHWLGITAAAAGAAAAWATAGRAIDLAMEGAAFKTQGASFANLAAASGVSADKMIADLRRVSGETVTVQQLVEKAGTAMLLGVETKAIPKLMEIAKASSRITGQTVTEAFGDLSLAVARQSKMILDNLGIMVDVEKANRDYAKSLGKTSEQLTDAEKRQAFLNATMSEGQEIIDKVGKTAIDNVDKINKMKTSIDDLKISFGGLISTPVAAAADELNTSVRLIEGAVNGEVSKLRALSEVDLFNGPAGFVMSLFHSSKKTKELIEGIKTTNLDANVTPEGQALAQRKIEEAAKKALEAENLAKAEAKKIADEKAAKDREKQLADILKHNDRILDIEKKRLSTSLAMEEDHLKKIVTRYETAVNAMDSLIDARRSIQDTFSLAEDALKKDEQADPYLKRLAALDDLDRKEQEVNNNWSLSAEEKAKKLAELAMQAATYKDAVVIDGVEVISQYEAEGRAQDRINRLKQETLELLDAEGKIREDNAVSLAEQMIAAEEQTKTFKAEIESLNTLLDGMNNKEINIIFKAQNAGQLLAAGGFSPPGEEGFTEPFVQGTNFHSGTRYVPASGLYPLARGEQVLSRNETGAARSSTSITVAPVIQLSGLTAAGAEKSGKELMREIEPYLAESMRKIANRSFK